VLVVTKIIYSVAPAALLPLMTLNHALFSHLAATADDLLFTSTPLFQSLCLSMAFALDGVLAAPGGGKKQRVKPTLRKAAVVRTRRVIRNNYRLIPDIFNVVYDAYNTHGERLLPILGVILAVSLRLKVITKKTGDDQPEQSLAKKYVAMQKDKLVELYLDKVLSSKTPVSRRVYSSMDDLWSGGLVTDEEWKTRVLPLVDRMLIRSPEVVLPSRSFPEHSMVLFF
jgi:hypothetical protein